MRITLKWYYPMLVREGMNRQEVVTCIRSLLLQSLSCQTDRSNFGVLFIDNNFFAYLAFPFFPTLLPTCSLNFSISNNTALVWGRVKSWPPTWEYRVLEMRNVMWDTKNKSLYSVLGSWSQVPPYFYILVSRHMLIPVDWAKGNCISLYFTWRVVLPVVKVCLS